MNNSDIKFILSDKQYTSDVYCNQYNFYTREYIYNFEFSVKIENNTDVVNNIVVYKNGIQYNEVSVYQNGNDFFVIKDKNVIKKGNYNFAVEIVLNGGKIYKNSFNLKILNNYIQNDLKIVGISTYGLHENFNYLKIIAKVDTQYDIDSVLIYNHYCPTSHINSKSYDVDNDEVNSGFVTHGYDKKTHWNYLGLMELNNEQYIFNDLLFDTTMTESRMVLYRIKIITSNGLVCEKTIGVLISPNTMSLNTISYTNTDKLKDYGVYGGIVGKINNKDSEFNGDFFELVIDKRDDEKNYLDIKLVHNQSIYNFHAENMAIKYDNEFNQNQTNKSPNVIEFSGEGIVNYKIDINNSKHDSARFNLRLICGDDYFCSFNIVPYSDAELSVKSDKTANNIIRYSSNNIVKYLDATYVDKTVSSDMQEGFFTYNSDDKMSFNALENTKTAIPIDKSQSYFNEAKYIIYNDKNFYFIHYDNSGIYIVKYDGINYNKLFYEVSLIDKTVNYLNNNPCLALDTNDNIRMHFIDLDNQNMLNKIKLEDSKLTVVDCSDMIAQIYNEIRKKLTSYINDIGYIVDNNVKYFIEADTDFTITAHEFNTMNEDNFVSNYTMQEFKYGIETTISVEFVNSSTNVKTHFNATMDILTTASVCIYDDNYNIEMQKYDFVIKSDNWNYKYVSNIKNQTSRNIMERMNRNYYLKFNKAVVSKTKDDYGYYRECILYNKTVNLYKLQLEDVYGVGTTNEYFKYCELCNIKVVNVDYKTIFVINVYNGNMIISEIDIQMLKRIHQYVLKSNMIFDTLYEFTKEQLFSFEQLLIGSYKYDTVSRNMLIMSISNYDN